MFQIMAEPDVIFFDMTEVQLEVEVAAPDPLRQQPVPAGPFLALALTANISLSAVLTAEPALTSTALACLSAAKSQGTVKAYTSVVNHFQAFCLLEGHPFPHFNTESVTQFALRHAARKTGHSFLSRIKPALVYLEAAMGRPTCFTPTTDLILKGAKRQARARSGPAKKAPALSPVKLASVLAKIYPIDDLVGMACPVRLRTAFRALFIYHTLCRYSCFSKLQAKHFEAVDNDILVTFPSSKNDQMHNGQQSCLAATDSPLCPVRITKLYFRRFGLRMGAAANDCSFISFRLRRESARLLPIRDSVLSSTRANSDWRQLLAFCGHPVPTATDKTPKMTGVTAAFDAGATALEVSQVGRWHTQDVVLRYKINSVAHKKKVALKVPSLQVP